MPRRGQGRRTPRVRGNWRAFLSNEAKGIAGLDLFVIPTATFRLLHVLVIVRHERRKVMHVNVTANSSAEWIGQQVAEAFPWETASKCLLRDRDSSYGEAFRKRVAGLGIREAMTAIRSPWQNPHAERGIRSIRREQLDHVVVLGEQHACVLLPGKLGASTGFR